MLQKSYTILLLLLITVSYAQKKEIKGTVSDASGVLPGVSIIVKGTTNGTTSDFDGKYVLFANVGDVLEFKYLGYVSVEKTVGEANSINVVLTEDASTLEEIVVVGYGTSTKKAYAGTAVRIRGASSLRGKVSGISTTVSSRLPQSGQLTAGEINDIDKWSEWKKIARKNKEFLKVKSDWQFHLNGKLEVEINNFSGEPLENATVFLYEGSKLISTAKSDVFGKVIVFRNLVKNGLLQVLYNNKVKGLALVPNQKTAKFRFNSGKQFNEVDLMFTIDSTGSMSDEINYLKSEIENIISRVDATITKKRVGLTFYRDHSDQYLTRDFDFSTDISTIKKNLINQEAAGGGDYEEAVEKALEVSLNKEWNKNAKARLLFLVLDAPPHLNKENIASISNQIQKAKKMGVKIIPIVSSGADKTVEFLMRYFSIATNGTYVFLTDDSGIGNPHLKATTKEFKVEKLNDLIIRLIEKYAGVKRTT